MVFTKPIMAILVAILAVAVYYLGLLDRPAFVYQKGVLPNGDGLYAVVATSTERNIGAHVMRLLNGTEQALRAYPGGLELSKAAAATYGSPAGAEGLSVGLYFDDPGTVDHPRWAIGLAVGVKDQTELDALVSKLSSDLPLKGVHIQGQALKARIPWRFSWTPMIAPKLHWPRGMKAYQDGGYAKSVGGPGGDQECVALEVYVTGPNDSMHYIDYIVLFGNTASVWDATVTTPTETAPKTAKVEPTSVSSEEESRDEKGEEDDGKEEDDSKEEDDEEIAQSGDEDSKEPVNEESVDEKNEAEDEQQDETEEAEEAGGEEEQQEETEQNEISPDEPKEQTATSDAATQEETKLADDVVIPQEESSDSADAEVKKDEDKQTDETVVMAATSGSSQLGTPGSVQEDVIATE